MEKQLFNYATDVSSKLLFPDWFEDDLYSSYHPRPSGSYAFQISQRNILFSPKFSPEYFAFGEARLTFSGTVETCKGFWGTTHFKVDMDIVLSDIFTFAGYGQLGTTKKSSPTAIGYRLETAGYLRPFTTKGTCKKEDYAFSK